MKPSLDQKVQKQIVVTQQNDFWDKFKGYFCPCFIPKSNAALQHSNLKNQLLQTSSVQSKYDSQLTQKEMRGEIAKMQIMRNTPKIRRGSYAIRQSNEQSQQRQEQISQQWRSEKSYRGTMELQKFHKSRVKYKEQMDLTIWNLNQKQLTIIGSNNHSMLVRVDPIELKPNFGKLKQIITRSSTKFSLTSRNQRTKDIAYKNYEFDRFWEDRYMFFQKFDEGIKIDQQSWSILPPECVSEYIASKFIGRRTVLDAFAGVGAVSIKLAAINTFQKVVSNQPNRQKLSFLLNNATIYEVQSYLQLSNRQFLKIEKGNFETIFVQPPLANLQARSSRGITLNDFTPSLDEIIKKSMSLSTNIIFLLPPETNIEQVCSCISKWGTKLKWMKDFCSASIEKIYWNCEMKFILLSVGKQLQNKIKLNDQLDFIYNRLRNWNDRFFKQKKIVKKIREDYGMIQLLNAVQQSELKKMQIYSQNSKYTRNIPIIQFFYEVILQKNLISEQRLNKIKLQQEENYDKKESMVGSSGLTEQKSLRVSPFIQEEKIQDNPTILLQAQLTSSEYSYASYFETLSKSSRHKQEILKRGNTVQSSKGVVIKRNPLSSQNNQYSRQNTEHICQKEQQQTAKSVKSIKQEQYQGGKKRSTQTKQKPEGYLSKRISKQS